jgi:hypothetical protein
MPTQSNLAVCDFDMRFTYVSVGQPGSIHDTSVLYKAIEVDKEFFPHPPKGNIFILLHLCYLLSIGYLKLMLFVFHL